MGSLYSRKQEGSVAGSARVQAAIGLTPWAAKVRAGIGFAFRPGPEGRLNAAGGSAAASDALFIFAARAATTPFESAC